ncbi:MAG: tRNA (adenosine(37)-N6)-dimethylallyltransferase MiaA [Deltaproteobacteria bacterium]|nr:tRNA (adenosine(37)-N6)-dimethylallyltransferase MiaA [Deltaproteobacteria bacterium]
MDKQKIIVIAGPTATGKSSLAIELAEIFNGEIINADSMQVYKYMDIGTAKPSAKDLSRVPHHLIGIAEPDEEYTAARFRSDAVKKIEEISGRGRTPFIAGGTGLYIRALTEGLFKGPKGCGELREGLRKEALEKGGPYLHGMLKSVDPVTASSIHPNNTVRVIRALEVFKLTGKPISEFHREHGFSEEPFDSLKIGLAIDRERLYGRIEERVEMMINSGLIGEVQVLGDRGYAWGLKPMCALGYKEISMYLRVECGIEEAKALLKRNTRHYAKRQLTWFRRDPEIRWFSPDEKNGIIELVKEHLK